MKKIINLIQIVFITGCILLPCSCDDFLTKEPPGVAAGTALESEQGVEALLIGAYAPLRGHPDRRFGGAMATDWVYGSGASDDCYKGSESGDQTYFNDVERYVALPDNLYMAHRWTDCYNGAARANEVLVFLKAAQGSGSPLSQKRASEIEGEAKFLRAWYHFQANKVFKNIPYIKTPEELGDILPEDVPNKDAGWDEIESDLQFAIDNLPERFSDPGRVTKYAAIAVKAHAHMHQNELDLAKPLLNQIIQSGQYALVDNYFDNYDERTENNKESIFEIQCSTSSVNETSLPMADPVMHQTGSAAAVGWGFFQPSQCLVDAFQVNDEGLPFLNINDRPTFKNDMGISSDDEFIPSDQPVDLRLDWTVSRRSIDYLGWGICSGRAWIRTQENGGPYMTKKYMHFQASQASINGKGFENNRNYRMYRYAHILLWRAECAVEDGELDKARELVNQIRERVKTSTPVMGLCKTTKFSGGEVEVDWDKPAANYKTEPYPAGHTAFSSKEKAREAVRHEIRLEFATEGQRFFDLRRWGIDVEVLTDFIKRDSEFRNFMKGAVYNAKKRYWPIPQTQLDIQPNLTQDPDYL